MPEIPEIPTQPGARFRMGGREFMVRQVQTNVDYVRYNNFDFARSSIVATPTARQLSIEAVEVMAPRPRRNFATTHEGLDELAAWAGG